MTQSKQIINDKELMAALNQAFQDCDDVKIEIKFFVTKVFVPVPIEQKRKEERKDDRRDGGFEIEDINEMKSRSKNSQGSSNFRMNGSVVSWGPPRSSSRGSGPKGRAAIEHYDENF